MSFGDRLKELRLKKGISQDELGELMGVRKSSISNWETNKATPTYDILTKLAEHFGVSTDYLLGYDKNYSEELEKLRAMLNENNLLNPDGTVKEEVNIAIEQAKRIKELYDRKGE